MTRSIENEIVRGRAPLHDVTKVEVVRDLVVRVQFDDGLTRVVDLDSVLHGPMFEPVRDPEFFRRVTVDPELGTIVWPNGADIAPEFLRGDGDRET